MHGLVIPDFNEEQLYNVKYFITGFRRSPSGKISPMWYIYRFETC